MDALGIRLEAVGAAADAALRDRIAERARALGVLGWSRLDDGGIVRAHLEGARAAVEALAHEVAAAADVAVAPARVEGHERFGVRGVIAGAFAVRRGAGGFELLLEVDGRARAWSLARGPSLDPSVRRLAVEQGARDLADIAAGDIVGESILWDRGGYEQGGRVGWPEALDRGHAMVVLHGSRLRGGFALQRTRPGARPGWLLVKRRDDLARPGSDVVAEEPGSSETGRTVDEVLGG